MLTLTPEAGHVIRDLVSRSELPEGAGLRIAGAEAPDGGAGLALQLAEAPHPADEVLHDQGADVFLDPPAAAMLDDQVLEAQAGEDGVTFSITARAG